MNAEVLLFRFGFYLEDECEFDKLYRIWKENRVRIIQKAKCDRMGGGGDEKERVLKVYILY